MRKKKMAKSDSQRAWEYRERKKAKEAAAKVAAVDACQTQNDWWQKNRAELDPEKLKQLQARHEQTLDMIHSMEHGGELDLLDPLYVSVEAIIDILLDDLSKGDCPHLGYILKNSDIPSDWSTGAWRDGQTYWHDPALVQMLEAEGPATALYVRYGFLSNPPDWIVVDFLTTHGWEWNKAAAVVGYYVPESNGRGASGPVVYR
jgi:hypothetical protein